MTENEKHLISCAESWRKSPGFQQWALSDNTPFQLIKCSFKVGELTITRHAEARAILQRGNWVFRAMLRHGYTGKDCETLEKSLIHAYNEELENGKRLDNLLKQRIKNETP